MSRIRRTLIASSLVVAAMGMAGCAASGAEADAEPGVQKVVVATGANPKPYTYLDDDDQLTGYDIEVLRAVDKLLPDVSFDFQVAEFDALFAGLDSGRYNIVANNLSATAERREKYDFTDPYLQAQFGVGVRPDSGLTNITKIDDLAGKKTYGQAGLNFTRVLEQYNDANPGHTIDITYSEADLQTQYKNLAAGAVDFLFTERVVFDGYGAAKLGLTFVPLDGDYLESTYGTSLKSAFAVSRHTENATTIESEINGALQKLNADGTLTSLSEKFFGLDLTPKQ
ncbi:transporter substrate-binding domain-containing protein [Microbacterium protaetiae]|uniref:Transporter substrate-binding domain-containing protein n=1 Tax=Microbacterium protaetiae TaxID=2509458 RepID=A0A4V0YDF1_9MICO|nr:transporter substrate-binding domain-containing protein [Microbacterium protaetiae]QAY60491.1 transporter substrate-binding domain-containing protein [Microbacterium protaetiae]